MSRFTPGTLPLPVAADALRDGQWVNEVKLFKRIFTVINATRRATRSAQFCWKAHQTTTTAIPNSTWTTVPMGAVDIDPWGMGIAGGGLVLPKDGTYAIAATGGFAANSSGNRRILGIGLDSVTSQIDGSRVDEWQAFSTGGTVLATPLGVVTGKAGQILTVNQWQDSGGSLNTTSGTSRGIRAALTVWGVNLA